MAVREGELKSTFELCTLVDELGVFATGEIAMNGTDGEKGAVFIERGRICWAAAKGLARRLTELLASPTGLALTDMGSHFQACKDARRPLGEYLVAKNVLSAEEFRQALLQHALESLEVLLGRGARYAFRAHGRGGFDPRFTFSSIEVASNLGAKKHWAAVAKLSPILATLFDGEGEWGAAFVRTPQLAFPEPIAAFGSDVPSTRELLRLGKWAASALDVTGAFTDREAMLTLSSPTGPASLVAFRDGETFVAGATGIHGPARILNARAKERRHGGPRDASL